MFAINELGIDLFLVYHYLNIYKELGMYSMTDIISEYNFMCDRNVVPLSFSVLAEFLLRA